MSLLFDPAKFWFIAARLTGFMTASPGIVEIPIPRMARAAFVIWLTVLLIPITPGKSLAMPTIYDAAYLLTAEFLIGMGLGTIVRLFFGVFQFGGSMIDSELGLLAAQQVNPLAPFSGGIFGQIIMIAGMFYFWSLDFFSLLIMALIQTFQIIPPGTATHSISNPELMIRVGSGIFAGGLMIAAPIISLMFFVTASVGLLARAVQGINLFSEALVLRILIGIGGVLFFLPLILLMIRDQLSRLMPLASEYLRTLPGVPTP